MTVKLIPVPLLTAVLAALVLASCGKESAQVPTQTPDPAPVTPARVIPGWLELPAITDTASFYTHSVTVNNVNYRNYSFTYDTGHLVAAWVAYPLTHWHTTSVVKRSENWYPNPKVSVQPNLYRSGDFYRNGYERGHQIPSADRLRSRDFNDQTFYYTNATPQLGGFNSGIWEVLESKVRTLAGKCDTLYVVTGCMVPEEPETVNDNDGKPVAIPSAYFKALLRYDSSSTVNGGYSGLGICLEHRVYAEESIERSMVISIDALESLTGIDFFYNLPAQIGSAAASAVEAEDPASNSIWW